MLGWVCMLFLKMLTLENSRLADDDQDCGWVDLERAKILLIYI